MKLFEKMKKNGGVMDEIRCDESSYLIWKWHPKNANGGDNNKENSIRFGSSLRVKDGEVAVFVYKQIADTIQEYIEGPFDGILKTKNLPVISNLVGLAYDGGTPFPAEVYFINLAQIVQVRFGVPFFDVYDPNLKEFGVPVSIRGTISFKIANYKEFIKLHRLIDFSLEAFQSQIKDVVIRYAKDIVTNAPSLNGTSLIHIETEINTINNEIELAVSERLKKDFGVIVTGLDIESIELDKSSDAYKELLSVTKNITSATIKAESSAKLKNIFDKQRADIKDYEENLRIQREERQYAQRKQTQSNNLTAYQIERQSEVGLAGAEALGRMGSNGAGSVNISNCDSGFNPAAMMAGMALGGAVGQNISKTMNNIMNGSDSNIYTSVTPPPLPIPKYYIAINNQQSGPFDKEILRKMAENGEFNKETLVWRDGMNDWTRADLVDDLKDVFPSIPSLPKNEE